ncbi:MAG: VWA domain-containing protein [Bryobacterales bacterium]|nr:VWA domain-containing protein [Bryobacterales bacterium]
MNGFAWLSPAALHFLWAIPLLLLLAARAERLRSEALAAFALEETRAYLAGERSRRRRGLKSGLALAAFVLAVLALARPSWDAGKPAPGKGRDIVVLLDVSRSMLARDLPPNRLEYAKDGLRELAGRLRGDRIGLVAFAGTSGVRCPLTTDFDFFRLALDEVSPESVTRGGTDIAQAIRSALNEGFDDLAQRAREIVILTDAEDHGLAAAAAAREAAGRSIRVSVVGLGAEANGARIPVIEDSAERFLTYRGAEVWSRLNSAGARLIAEAGGGRAALAGRGAMNLGEELAGLLSASRGRAQNRRREVFAFLLAAAVASLLAALAVPERKRS